MKIKIEWPNFIVDCETLACMVRTYHERVHITDVVSIARGGGWPAQLVAYRCNIPRIISFGISYYDKNDNRMNEPVIYQDIPTNLEDRHLLLVDEICDSGSTFHYVTQKIKEHGCSSVATACVYRKKGCMFIPDICVHEAEKDEWLVMPYED